MRAAERSRGQPLSPGSLSSPLDREANECREGSEVVNGMGRWDEVRLLWEAQEGLQGQVEPARKSRCLSDRLGLCRQRGWFPQGMDGTRRSLL